ncbi:MAG TPA: GNAT family N-acetyltransferase [Firmicutes bacterium]|nr:GNAT family N-acetyltransferase [Bacillota bacterium]
MMLRPYRPEDCPALLSVFYRAVHEAEPGHAACQDAYSRAQRDAWAPLLTGRKAAEREAAWAASLAAHTTLVAEEGKTGASVGFADLDGEQGYLDRLYVLPVFRGQGIASALVEALEQAARAAGRTRIFTHASLTARPFFERHGYRVVRRQTVERLGVPMENLVMEKEL